MSSKLNEFSRATWRLTSFYLLGIFIILSLSSATLYILFTSGTPVPSLLTWSYHSAITTDQFNSHELFEHLSDSIIFVNLLIFFSFAVAAYFFARRTLKPIETMYKKQEQFVGDVAHELRTPLTVMKSGAETILRKPRSVPEYHEFITDSLEEINRMSRLTNDLLYVLAQTNQPPKLMSRTNLVALITEVCKYYQTYASERRVRLTTKLPDEAWLSIIPDSFVRMVHNLIKNAIDYNRPDGMVTVTLHDALDSVSLTIIDTGIGMNQGDTTLVFDRFYKTDTARQSHPNSGTGLGLSIVKEIVQLHHGTINLTSLSNQGTTVTVWLPKGIT